MQFMDKYLVTTNRGEAKYLFGFKYSLHLNIKQRSGTEKITGINNISYTFVGRVEMLQNEQISNKYPNTLTIKRPEHTRLIWSEH